MLHLLIKCHDPARCHRHLGPSEQWENADRWCKPLISSDVNNLVPPVYLFLLRYCWGWEKMTHNDKDEMSFTSDLLRRLRRGAFGMVYLLRLFDYFSPIDTPFFLFRIHACWLEKGIVCCVQATTVTKLHVCSKCCFRFICHGKNALKTTDRGFLRI